MGYGARIAVNFYTMDNDHIVRLSCTLDQQNPVTILTILGQLFININKIFFYFSSAQRGAKNRKRKLHIVCNLNPEKRLTFSWNALERILW